MEKSGQPTVFGTRVEPHTVIIARGNDVRHFTVRPWIAAALGSALSALAVGYLLATSYLVLRDDLIGAQTARQARLQQAYEDRISALRAQVDRITSRQLLDQQLVDTKVSELLKRQAQLTSRHGRLEPLLERADTLEDTPSPAQPDARPEIRAGLNDGLPAQVLAFAGATPAVERLNEIWPLHMRGTETPSAADKADRLFATIGKSLQKIEGEQLARIDSLTESAYQTADAIAQAFEAADLPSMDDDFGKSDIGGPLIALDNPSQFDAKMRELDDSLDRLDKMKNTARRLPIANPAPGRSVSSTFGVRRDPLIGTPALHSGMDFRAPQGSPARVTAPGTVVRAGWNGGYGRMVEIDHGNGFSTRYGHLSRIDVKEGQKVSRGDAIGQVGSTGRSTGPHLHYEVRYKGEALNPLRFLKLGKQVGQYL
ncbi:peptidase M23-like protein [Pseudaminobacter salicylatoxidans]|uniref:Peptidase M23-like protein n=1 Tax=Pseudaminobacter salicylatoxidans TaxID=93369 RepID=A0A316CV24_PSESE|nr:peptidoglycan DD-metalloendopeptidase family protein [Pseudaminobacter salicylatoxidans]PWJ85934.1 peptidase M23-like protein [Pseudaminobacter salicylatoxidans]